jgi:hypothetical protein
MQSLPRGNIPNPFVPRAKPATHTNLRRHAELRNQIYTHLDTPYIIKLSHFKEHPPSPLSWPTMKALTQTCPLLRAEVLPIHQSALSTADVQLNYVSELHIARYLSSFHPLGSAAKGSLRIVVPRHTFTISIPLLHLLDASPNFTLSVVDSEGNDAVADALIDIRGNSVWRSYVTTHVRHLEYLREKKFPCLRFTLAAEARREWMPGPGTSRVFAYHAQAMAWLRDVGLEWGGTEDVRVQITVAKE